MNKTLQISAVLDQPGLLESLVEKLADRHYDIGYSNAAVPGKAIDTSSVETYVSGTIAFADANDNEATINMPFITCFLFTCAKEKEGLYKLAWSSSLS